MESIIRIEIDFALKEDENPNDLLYEIGDIVTPMLDPHDDNDNCSRWVSVAAYQIPMEDYEVGFSPEDEEEMLLTMQDPSWLNN